MDPLIKLIICGFQRKRRMPDCYNRALKMFSTLQNKLPAETNLPALLCDWREDTMNFMRHEAPKIVLVLIGAYILTRILRTIARKSADLHTRKLPSGVRLQQVRTVASVITSVGVFVIVFVAALMVLSDVGLNLGPMLASAGIAGLAIGFGAQTLVHDFINGFFILLENQYDVGDIVKLAGVQGTVEVMTLRKTVLRDSNGTVHTVPNSEVHVVSNLTRDWAQISLHVSVDYGESSENVMRVLQEAGAEVYEDPAFTDLMVALPEVPGIERITGHQVDYLMLAKVKPGQQWVVSRELRRRIKDCLAKNNIQASGPAKIYVAEGGQPASEINR